MYAFLGFVERENIMNGSFKPSFILHHDTGNKLPFKPCGTDRKIHNRDRPIVLVTSFHGNEDLEEYMAHIKRDRFKYKGGKKVGREQHTLVGAVFWFECDVYGEPNGRCLYVRDYIRFGQNRTLAEILQEKPRKLMSQVWSEEPCLVPLDTERKIALPQHQTLIKKEKRSNAT